jgi:hypothetical protein
MASWLVRAGGFIQIIGLPDTPVTVSGDMCRSRRSMADGSAGGGGSAGLQGSGASSLSSRPAVRGRFAGLLIVGQLIREGWGAVGVRVRARGNCGWLGSRRPAFGPWPMRARRRGRWRLRAAAGRQWRRARGFAGVFSWREPGQVRFAGATAGPDRMRETQRRFLAPRCVASGPPASSSSRSRPAIRSAPPQRPELVAAALPEASQITFDHLRAGCG